MDYIDLQQFQGFDWDLGNQNKNWQKHGVVYTECEQIFFNIPLLIEFDAKHSDKEARHFALGRTDDDRYLFIAFTCRGSLIRVISARDMNKKERGLYENFEKNTEI